MSMREKIAMAIANADDSSHVILGRGAFTNSEWKGFEKIADAVLDALMEPTEGMKQIGVAYANWPNDELGLHMMGSSFKAMIRAAKEGK